MGVGVTVGSGVGDAVGLGVGVDVGRSVGVGAGVGVGVVVGTGVGTGVPVGRGVTVGVGAGSRVATGTGVSVTPVVGPVPAVTVGVTTGTRVAVDDKPSGASVAAAPHADTATASVKSTKMIIAGGQRDISRFYQKISGRSPILRAPPACRKGAGLHLHIEATADDKVITPIHEIKVRLRPTWTSLAIEGKGGLLLDFPNCWRFHEPTPHYLGGPGHRRLLRNIYPRVYDSPALPRLPNFARFPHNRWGHIRLPQRPSAALRC